MSKPLAKYTSEAFDHLMSDIEQFKKTLFGFHKAFNSNKNTTANKNEFPMININQFLNIQTPPGNYSINSVNNTNQNFYKTNKFQNEEAFTHAVFQILLGEELENMLNIHDLNFFKNFNSINQDIIQRIREHNINIIQSIFKTIEPTIK